MSVHKFNYSINRYNGACQHILKAKTKPEPWLHVAIIDFEDMPDSEEYGIRGEKSGIYWAIYVWDTREVIEAGSARSGSITIPAPVMRTSPRPKVAIPNANDNRNPLRDYNQIINTINAFVMGKQSPRRNRYAI